MVKAQRLTELQTIPGVGPAISAELYGLGITSVQALRGKKPERLYARLCRQTEAPVDRCVLYVFRCTVYFASHKRHDPARLRWWYWKDGQP